MISDLSQKHVCNFLVEKVCVFYHRKQETNACNDCFRFVVKEQATLCQCVPFGNIADLLSALWYRGGSTLRSKKIVPNGVLM